MTRFSMSDTARVRCAPLFVSALLLAGCGGGGGGGGAGGGAINPPPGAATITSANHRAVAADALDTATNASIPLLAVDTMTSLQLAPPVPAARRPLVASVAGVLRSPLLRSASLPRAAQTNVPLPCETGSGTLTAQLAHPSGVAAGDSLVIVADQCRVTVDDVPVTTTGRLTLRVVGGAFDPATARFQFALQVDADRFTVRTPGETDVATGSQRVEVAESGAGQGSMTISGDMTYEVATDAGTHVSTLRNGSQSFTHDGDLVTVRASGAVETGNRFVGSISYGLDTPAPLNTRGGTITAGSLRAQAARSALFVTAIGNSAFRLELDDDGDGAAEAGSEASEAELRGLL